MRVAQGTVARTRVWNLEQWRVRWKVTAAVAVPLAAAMLLGGLRLSVSFGDYSTYDDAADRISDIPVITALESAASTVAGGQVYGTTTDQDLVELSTAITSATVRAGRPGLDATVVTALRQMTATSEVIRSGGKGGGDPLKAVSLNNAVVREAIGTIDNLLTPIQIASVVVAKTQLFDLLYGKVEGFNWLMSAMSAIQNPKKVDEFNAEQGAFVAMTNTVERDLPSAKPDLDRVVRANNVALKETIDEAIRTGQVNQPDLRSLAIGSRDVFTKLADETVERIIADVDHEANAARSAAIQASLVVLGTLVAALVLAALVARSLLRPLRRLQAGAAKLADRDLPDEVERISLGARLEHIVVIPVPVHTGGVIGEIARTVDRLHAQALKLAVQQQLLRDQINDMFEIMARRNQTLVDRQLSMIDALEFEEKDPDRLDHLFRLDHLAARMRRNSANLLVLAGTKSRPDRSGPVEVRDILRAALSEVEDYQRVKAGATPDGWVAGAAATDLVHLIAELLENALRASPPDSGVTIAYSRTSEGGLLVEVIDEGIGIVAGELDDINRRLSTLVTATLATTRQMGLFVVGRLAERHGITVRLRRTQDNALNPGITASLHIPAPLISVPPQERDTPANGHPIIPVPRDAMHPGPGARPTTTNTLPSKSTPPQSKPTGPRAKAPGPQTDTTKIPAVKQGLAPRPAAAPEPAQVAPVITSYGLPKRVPGANRRGSRKSGGSQRRTPAAIPAPTATATTATSPTAAARTATAPTAPDQPASTTSASNSTAPDTHQFRVAKTASFFRSASKQPTSAPAESEAPPTEPAAPTPSASQPAPPTAQLAPPPAESAPPPAQPSSGPTAPESLRAQSLSRPEQRSSMLAESDSPAAQAANAPAQPTSRPAQPTRSTPTADDSATTPIFEEMISAWLADPMASQEEAPVSWNSAADEGWSAARRAAEPPITKRTKSGLPRREPGNQLVPGGAEPGPSVQEEPTQARPEPESIRAGLNSYDRGVRDGRSIRSSNPFAAEDIR